LIFTARRYAAEYAMSLRGAIRQRHAAVMASGLERCRQLCQHPLIDTRSYGVLPTLEQRNRTDKLSTY